MAKNSNGGTVVVERVKKAKSAAQLAKKAANVKAAAERLARLQASQRVVAGLRKLGWLGTDADILDRHERVVEARLAREYVNGVLSGPHGERVSRFLGDRVKGEPTKIASVVRKYCQTQGW